MFYFRRQKNINKLQNIKMFQNLWPSVVGSEMTMGFFSNKNISF